MYKVNISGQHVTVSDDIQAYVEDSIRTLERFSDQITSVNVNFTTEKHDTHKIIAEAQIHIPGNDIVATSSADRHIKHAVDGLLSKLENQMRKHKSKSLDKAHSGNQTLPESPEERALQDEYNELADRGVVG
ncbi:ribosome hibernation-promoting factor, HPF/YfiA family [Psychrobium sp. 1_MG-2023]|uniref:ribosome hibernation-promoting factor, HPF/YfiA family n=1 Tax=Psychrobium sp. 1_MG-2023 TaxID=3062624 RepID=UPI000C31F1CE|nr:ribosome-associated translation inhibitor RaiA [Psychrobium sp. 1_MG-2023]MDP2561438.1 ribosome-associated translation inhibitor RaiA [Psychrobium sp. 1_MG-2023]PKF57705.1 ribosomal subunit interface protein [Alteromonadales bacterium alter-6D02]